MKSVRISDGTYAKIARHAKKNKRAITATIDILINKAIDSEERAATFDTSPYSPIDWSGYGDDENEAHSASEPIRRAGVKEMTEEEMRQMSQSIRNKSYYNQAMSDEE